MEKKNIIQNLISFLMIPALIFNVGVSGISNNSTVFLILKFFASIILFIIFLTHLNLSGVTLKFFLKQKSFHYILFIILIIIVYLSVTLTYSSNPNYGEHKIINIIISAIPNIIVMFYLLYFIKTNTIKDYFITVIIISIILTLIAVFIFRPFDHLTIYQFSPQRWSHVFVGRLISFLSLIMFLFIVNASSSGKIIIYSAVFVAGLYVIYLTGLRSALLGLILFSIIIFVWFYFQKQLSIKHLLSFIFIFIFVSVLILMTPQQLDTSSRFSNMLKVENLEFGGDGPILSRVDSYTLSWQMFKEKPLFGWGFGSFNGFNNIKWTYTQKYPHNLILEILSELGLIGLTFFIWIDYLIIKGILNQQHSTIGATSNFIIPDFSFLILFIFSLWLSMWAKDISTQGFLWLFIVFASRKDKSKNNVNR